MDGVQKKEISAADYAAALTKIQSLLIMFPAVNTLLAASLPAGVTASDVLERAKEDHALLDAIRTHSQTL